MLAPGAREIRLQFPRIPSGHNTSGGGVHHERRQRSHPTLAQPYSAQAADRQHAISSHGRVPGRLVCKARPPQPLAPNEGRSGRHAFSAAPLEKQALAASPTVHARDTRAGWDSRAIQRTRDCEVDHNAKMPPSSRSVPDATSAVNWSQDHEVYRARQGPNAIGTCSLL